MNEITDPIIIDPRWRSVSMRDRAADGAFFYAVRTTGVYCRPSCAARRPNPRNVAFYGSADEAEQDGFRPCLRCHPRQDGISLHSATVAMLCRMIEQSERAPGLAALAIASGLSRYHLQRVFKAHLGVSPKAYAAAHRAKLVRRAMAQAGSVTEAIFAAGFSESGRFYAQSGAILGMTPTRFRAGGAGLVIHYALGQSTLGLVLAAATARGVCAILLGDDAATLLDDLQARFDNAELRPADAGFARLVAIVVGLIENPARGLDLPLDIRGTAFQLRVWAALRRIPAGETRSYAALAAMIGQPKAIRAVASACAANPLAVAVPCHRAVARDGGMAGYRWGVARKRELLTREAGPENM